MATAMPAQSATPIARAIRGAVMLWGYPLQFWQTIVFWLWAIAAGAGGIAVAASFGSSIVSYYISDATETAAKIEIDKAKAVAGRANEAAGEANERAAKLRLAFEQEQVKRLQLEKDVGAIKPQVQSLMPPRLSADQIASLSKTSPPTGDATLVIGLDMGASNLRDYAVELATALQAAGWKIKISSIGGISNPPKTGIALKGNQQGLSKNQQIIANAFQVADIPFDLQADRVERPKMPPLPPGFRPYLTFPGQGPDDVELVVTFPAKN